MEGSLGGSAEEVDVKTLTSYSRRKHLSQECEDVPSKPRTLVLMALLLLDESDRVLFQYNRGPSILSKRPTLPFVVVKNPYVALSQLLSIARDSLREISARTQIELSNLPPRFVNFSTLASPPCKTRIQRPKDEPKNPVFITMIIISAHVYPNSENRTFHTLPAQWRWLVGYPSFGGVKVRTEHYQRLPYNLNCILKENIEQAAARIVNRKKYKTVCLVSRKAYEKRYLERILRYVAKLDIYQENGKALIQFRKTYEFSSTGVDLEKGQLTIQNTLEIKQPHYIIWFVVSAESVYTETNLKTGLDRLPTRRVRSSDNPDAVTEDLFRALQLQNQYIVRNLTPTVTSVLHKGRIQEIRIHSALYFGNFQPYNPLSNSDVHEQEFTIYMENIKPIFLAKLLHEKIQSMILQYPTFFST